MTKILLTAFGSRGDIQPMLVLARALQQRGHEVLACASPNFAAWAAELGIPFCGIGRDFEEWMGQNAKLITSLTPRELRQIAMALREDMVDQFRGLRQATAGYDMLLGFGAQMAGPSIAHFHKIPYRYITYCPAMYPSRHHPPMSFAQYNCPPWLNPLLWKLNGTLFNWLMLGTINSCRIELELPPIRDLWVHGIKEYTVLAASPHLAPLPPDTACRQQTGFLRFHSNGTLSSELEAFIQSGTPPIYIGLGSMVDGAPKKLTQLFIDAIQQAGIRALIAKGWAGLNAENLPENIRLIGATPHDVLFPLLSGIVHHGGAGTTSTAALAGVPQLALPILLDQYYWGKQINQLHLGPPMLPRQRLTVEKLARALQALVGEARYRKKAQHMSLHLQQEDGVGQTVTALEL